MRLYHPGSVPQRLREGPWRFSTGTRVYPTRKTSHDRRTNAIEDCVHPCNPGLRRHSLQARQYFHRQVFFNYVAQIFQDKRIKITFGNNPGYFHETKEHIIEENAHPASIVHESTHILINATHQGQVINQGYHEAAAYLAESLWALNSKRPNHIENDHICRKCISLAHKVNDYNARNPDAYGCEMADIVNLIATMDQNGVSTSENYVQISPYAA
jgi:hypothetical protein